MRIDDDGRRREEGGERVSSGGDRIGLAGGRRYPRRLFAGLVLGIWPNIVPPGLTIWDAASPPSSQGFVLVGLIVLLPAILGYTYWSYSVFKGKVAADAGYH